MGFPGNSDGKEPACNAGDRLQSSGWEDTQYSFMENSMDREVWQATVHGVAKSQTRLSD